MKALEQGKERYEGFGVLFVASIELVGRDIGPHIRITSSRIGLGGLGNEGLQGMVIVWAGGVAG